ncbi:MAG: hypothetical protein AAGJ54_08210 [Planctomycetota bacterium]
MPAYLVQLRPADSGATRVDGLEGVIVAAPNSASARTAAAGLAPAYSPDIWASPETTVVEIAAELAAGIFAMRVFGRVAIN